MFIIRIFILDNKTSNLTHCQALIESGYKVIYPDLSATVCGYMFG